MSIEESIKELDEIAEVFEELSAEVCARTDLIAMWEGRANGIRQAISLIKNHLSCQSNDPLTLEELREMDGEPVWNDTVKKYALVDARWWDGIGRTINSDGKYRLLDDRYYRRKPEEETI